MKWRIILSVFLGICGGGCATSQIQQQPIHSQKKMGLFDRWQKNQPQELSPALAVEPEEDSLGLRWPLRGVAVTSSFGKRGRQFHEGVDLRASVGTPVYAAQSGRVIYANSQIRGYGRMIVIRHSGEITTVYAHNSRLLVRKGQQIQKGQQIAVSGKTGHVSGPHLHFEVRKGFKAVNPLDVLPHLTAHRQQPRA